MRTIKQIYPPLLVSMILFVQVIAFMLNREVYNFRELLILFCWIPVFTIPYILIKKKIVYRIIAVIFFLEGFLGLFHWIILKGPLTASSLFVMFNTNYSEAKEFLELKFSFSMLLVIPYILLFFLAIKKVPEIATTKYEKYIIGAVSLFSLVFICENIINGRFIRKGIPQNTKAVIYFVDEMKTFNALKKRKIQKVACIKNNKEGQVLVLIIGESCSRNHMSLYKYNKQTNPRLEKRKDIIVFNNVISPYSNTLNSLLSSLTESNIENKKNFNESVSLIDVFYSAGFKTYWISNQSPIGIWDNAVYNIAQTAAYKNFLNNGGNSSFESTYIRSYDDILFAPLRKALNETVSNKFIVIHLMGSHSSYKKRYPEEFNIFKDGTSKRTELINEYDNSLLYNDYIIDSMINILCDYSKEMPDINTSAIYFSDHGENVYDESDNVGHDYSGNMPKSIANIPFIVWVSPTFIETDSVKYKVIKSATNLPFVNDDLYHTIIDISNISVGNYDSTRSIFNPSYNPKRKRILEDNTDYDSR